MTDYKDTKNPAIRANVRPNTIDPRSLQVDVFPYDAFQFDKDSSPPRVYLIDPWVFDVGEIVANQITGGVTVEGNTSVQITDFPIVEVAAKEGSTLVWYNRIGQGIWSKDRALGSAETKVSDKDLRNLFITSDSRVGGISVGDLPGVWIGDTRYITDEVVSVAFKDWENVYCVLNDDHYIYKYNLLTNTRVQINSDPVQWVAVGCDGTVLYQKINGIYSYDGVSESLVITGVYYSAYYNNDVLVLHSLTGRVYSYDGTLIDTGIDAYDTIYCEGLYVIDPIDLTLSVNLENALLEGVVLTGDTHGGTFIGTSVIGSFTLTALDTDEMKKVFVHDIISGGGFSNAEVVYKGVNYIRLSVQATEANTNFSYTVTGTRITLNANQVLIPGTVTAELLEASAINSKATTVNGPVFEADLDNGDIVMRDPSGNKTFDFDASTGDLALTGTLTIGSTGTDVADVEITADSKVKTFYQTTAPTATTVGDLWVDTDDDNKMYRWSGSAWVTVQDGTIATAQATADGKNTVFRQASIPTSLKIGDIWYDTDDNNTMYTAASAGADQIATGEWEAKVSIKSPNWTGPSSTSGWGILATGSAYFNDLTARGYPKELSTAISLTVGPTGDYSSINDALEYLSGFIQTYQSEGFNATITLQSTFTMEEQVIVKGYNFGWVTITSGGNIIDIDYNYLTSSSETNSYKCAFAAISGGVLPTFDNANFNAINTSATGTFVFCFIKDSGSYAFLGNVDVTNWTDRVVDSSIGGYVYLGACGMTGADYGLVVNQGGKAFSYFCSFNNSIIDGVNINDGEYGSFLTSANSSATGISISDSFVHLDNFDATSCTSNGLAVNSGKVILTSCNFRKGASDSSSDILVRNKGQVQRQGGNGGLDASSNWTYGLLVSVGTYILPAGTYQGYFTVGASLQVLINTTWTNVTTTAGQVFQITSDGVKTRIVLPSGVFYYNYNPNTI